MFKPLCKKRAWKNWPLNLEFILDKGIGMVFIISLIIICLKVQNSSSDKNYRNKIYNLGIIFNVRLIRVPYRVTNMREIPPKPNLSVINNSNMIVQ